VISIFFVTGFFAGMNPTPIIWVMVAPVNLELVPGKWYTTPSGAFHCQLEQTSSTSSIGPEFGAPPFTVTVQVGEFHGWANIMEEAPKQNTVVFINLIKPIFMQTPVMNLF
jgi:hypothetical protein